MLNLAHLSVRTLPPLPSFRKSPSLKTMLGALLPALVLSLTAPAVQAQQPAAAPLSLKVLNADANSFHVNATVISGATEAVVIDTGFSRADALRIAAQVLDTGKKLTTIFISNADPDYYFGAETLKALFPQAVVLTTQAVREQIAAKLPAKLGFWGPKLGANAPKQPIVPDLLVGEAFKVDGETIEVRGTKGELAHRPYLWVPSLKAIVGNVAVFGQLHVWTADTQKPSQRQAWLAQLDAMQALQPQLVVPGHMAAGTPLDTRQITYTRDYLRRFEVELPKAANGAALKAAMQQAYPQAGLPIALDIGSKVAKGEMPW